jgi:hypothetical protein
MDLNRYKTVAALLDGVLACTNLELKAASTGDTDQEKGWAEAAHELGSILLQLYDERCVDNIALHAEIVRLKKVVEAIKEDLRITKEHSLPIIWAEYNEEEVEEDADK